MTPWQIFWMFTSFLLVIIFIIILIYIIGTQYSKLNKSRNMVVVESLSLGVDKALHLIKIGDKYFVISSTKHNMSHIAEVPVEELDLSEKSVLPNLFLDKMKTFTFNNQPKDFKAILDRIKKNERK